MAKIKLEEVRALCETAIQAHNMSRDAIQAACVALIQHAHEHGDKRPAIELANNLVNALEGANRYSLVQYFVKFGGMAVDGTALINRAKEKVDLEGAVKTSWWSVKKEKNPFREVDFLEETLSFLHKLENARKKAQKEDREISIHPSLRTKLAELEGLASHLKTEREMIQENPLAAVV